MKNRDLQSIIDEKYDFWINDHPDLTGYSSEFWFRHKLAEPQKRMNHLQLLDDCVDDIAGKDILDVGIAWGMWPHIMSSFGANVTGIDWAELYSNEGLNDRHPTLANVCAFDFTKDAWPFEDNSFDVITHLDLIEHVHPPLKHMLDEMYRVLKPGGKLLLTTPNLASLRKRISMILGKSPASQIDHFYSDDPFIEHIKEYTMSELIHLCKLTNFKVESRKVIDHLYYYQYAHAGIPTRVVYKLYKWGTYLNRRLKDTLVIIASK